MRKIDLIAEVKQNAAENLSIGNRADAQPIGKRTFTDVPSFFFFVYK